MIEKQCPMCHESLVRRTARQRQGQTAISWKCPTCSGRMIGVSVIRQSIPAEQFRTFWRGLLASQTHSSCCGICKQPMRSLQQEAPALQLDVCQGCYMMWMPSETIATLQYHADSSLLYSDRPSRTDLELAKGFTSPRLRISGFQAEVIGTVAEIALNFLF
ncbi:MAG: hypothetical protein EP343_25270 [Deltaproteobacteria bacterium]|nr:MAG: hypothetical protein EP343_25270 [Deltaproteobacteria bacterium]